MYSIKGAFVYSGKTCREQVYINWRDKRIVDISDECKGEPLGEYAFITPAFIDAHSHIGMHRFGEHSDQGEANETLESIIPLADALDSVYMDDQYFKDSIESGVLYSCIVPGSGNIIGGRSCVIRNYAKSATEALIARAGIKAALGYNPMSVSDWKGRRPQTRMGAMALLREKLYDALKKKRALERKDKDKDEAADGLTREQEILLDILGGVERLRVHVHKSDDIESLLRLMDEMKAYDDFCNMNVVIEHAMDVHDASIFKKLKERNIPVVYGPMDSFAYKVELKHEHWKNAAHLMSSGVTFGLMTDHPVVLQRHLHLQLRWFLRLGMKKQDAVDIITGRNAQILGIDHLLGTLEPGRWASFVCWNGDPFDLSRYPRAVYGEGRLLHGAE